MNNINKLFFVIYSMFLFAGSGTAVAACNQADAKGTWRVHGITVQVDGISEKTVPIKCKLKVSSGGGISASKSTCKWFPFGSTGTDEVVGSTITVIGGELVMASNCAMSGRLTFLDGLFVNFRSGQMDRSKNSFSLMGLLTGDQIIHFILDGIRQ